jgi:uncharacterized protein
MLHTDLLILQPTPFCNLDCSYCYLPDRDNRLTISDAVVDAVFGGLLPSRFVDGRLTVCWHAGEPLVLPPERYESWFSCAERHRPVGLEICHALQSNGTLLNARWVKLIQNWPARVSLSIDGPAWLHDLKRRTRRGGGTHAAAMRGLRVLQEAGLCPPVITVLTRKALDAPDELFEFYRNAGIRDVAFNVEEVEAAHVGDDLLDPGYEAAFETFIRRFLARMAQDPGVLELREHRAAMSVLTCGSLPNGMNQETEPMRIVSVSAEGDVSTFSPELLGMQDTRYGSFTFGNVLRDNFDTIADRVLGSRLAADIRAGVGSCHRSCAWYGACGGGSPSNRLYETGSFRIAETAYCRLTRQAVLRAVLDLGSVARPAAVLAAAR